jgi:hypothetical protein
VTYLKTRQGARINTDLVESIAPTTIYSNNADHKAIVVVMASGQRHVLSMTVTEYFASIGHEHSVVLTEKSQVAPVQNASATSLDVPPET